MKQVKESDLQCNMRNYGDVRSIYCQTKCPHRDFHEKRKDCHCDGDQCIYTGLWCKCV